MIHKLTAVALGASAALLTTSAFAQGPGASAPTPAPETTDATPAPEPSADSDGGRHPVSVELLVGFGIGNVFRNPRAGGDVVNPYALGIGLRAGYTLPMNLYLGATFIYHQGYSVPQIRGETYRINPLGVESGYGFNMGPIVLRPFFGLGLGLYSAFTNTGGNPFNFHSGAKFAFWPGVLALYNITNQIFVGADIRYTIVTGMDLGEFATGNANAFGLYANGGYRF
jgi:outer membrane protein with beta-barrel domain